MANLIDGKTISQTIQDELKAVCEDLNAKTGKAPGLGVVIVGERKDSQTYVRMKKRACEKVGITSISKELPADITQDDLIKVVQEMNDDPEVDGILVQLPLPEHINEEAVLNAIRIEKDVDGFHPENIGKIGMRGRDPLFVSCTPKGCIELLDRSGVKIEGKHAVVLGRSNIVGLPVSLLLLGRNATVTICHSRTADIAATCREADIVIAAIGKAEFVKGDWIKPGAVVIDVGINSVDDASSAKGYRLVGDCDFEECKKNASLITPVPGGVGPMTIAMLLSNCIESAKRRLLPPQ
eukprot:GFYU01002269.1.p2 GENE.GFYU01002269.1~~GFYU01002269.1.p2  ORF type:complete len:295 (+),score=103.28 GFYU01002269.1:75-959(+)